MRIFSMHNTRWHLGATGQRAVDVHVETKVARAVSMPRVRARPRRHIGGHLGASARVDRGRRGLPGRAAPSRFTQEVRQLAIDLSGAHVCREEIQHERAIAHPLEQ